MNPEDFVAEDGSVDARGLGDRSTTRTKVAPSTCREWRERVASGTTAREVSQGLDQRYQTVCRHVRGDCDHDPGHPPLIYNHESPGWSIDARPKCDRCGAVDGDDFGPYCEDCYETLRRRGVAVDLTRGD